MRFLSRPAGQTAIIAGAVVVVAVVVRDLILASHNTPDSFWGVDFGDYWLAGGRVLSGHAPYAPDMLAGPFPAIGLDRFRYPPPFALALAPLALLSENTATWVWIVISALAMLIGCLLAARAGGVKLTVPAVAGIVVLLCLCGPVVNSLLVGNVEGLEVLLVGLALAGAPLLGTAVTGLLGLLKIVPILAWPAALLRSPRIALRGFALVALGLLITLPWLAAGWLAFPTVLINQWLGGGADQAVHFGLAHVASLLAPGAPLAEAAARAVSLGLTATLFGLSLAWARRPGGWPSALLAAIVAGLLLPDTLWFHYFALLVPFALFAWPKLGVKSRIALVVLLAMLRFGSPEIVALEDLLVGGLVVGLLLCLRPRTITPAAAIETLAEAS